MYIYIYIYISQYVIISRSSGGSRAPPSGGALPAAPRDFPSRGGARSRGLQCIRLYHITLYHIIVYYVIV